MESISGSSSSPNLVSVERDKVMKDVAVVSMKHSPSNLLDRRLLRELISVIGAIEADPSYRGLVLTSSIPQLFCGGLDIAELHGASFDQFRHFWTALQDLWVKLYLSRLVTIAALNGTTVAGGCLLAISCDSRIMAKGPYSIGFPEAVIGLSTPIWIYETLSRLIGHRKAETSIQLGTEYSVNEAEDIGLIDDVVHPKKLMDACREEMAKWLRIPDISRVKNKNTIRQPVVMTLQGNPEGDTQSVFSYISQSGIQETLATIRKKFEQRDKTSKK